VVGSPGSIMYRTGALYGRLGGSVVGGWYLLGGSINVVWVVAWWVVGTYSTQSWQRGGWSVLIRTTRLLYSPNTIPTRLT
jgi:hypothetical protein